MFALPQANEVMALSGEFGDRLATPWTWCFREWKIMEKCIGNVRHVNLSRDDEVYNEMCMPF